MSLTGKEVAQMHKDYVMQSWARSGADTLPVERAEGIYFYDYDGKKYADMASLLVCSNLGHELPEIVEAIKEQADKMCFMAPAYASEPKSMLAKMLVEAAGADTYNSANQTYFSLLPAECYTNPNPRHCLRELIRPQSVTS